MQASSQQNLFPIRTVLVPQGAEYQAVQRGCQRVQAPVSVVALPMGAASAQRLQRWLAKYTLFAEAGYVLMGLGGSLSPLFQVGDVVICHKVVGGEAAATCALDEDLNHWLRQQLPGTQEGIALGSDRIITQAKEKQGLHQQFGADVVEMEALAIAKLLQGQGKRLAMVRVISDDCNHDLPDISSAIKPDGSLRPLTMTAQFLKHPIGASRLVTGSLKALKVLEITATQLFQQG
jgi:uridine phosphorylase